LVSGARTVFGVPRHVQRGAAGVVLLGGPPGDILAFVALGMDAGSREVFGLVRARLEEIADEQADEDADAE
jgi:hypothetical protein